MRLDETIAELDSKTSELSKALMELTYLEQSLMEREVIIRWASVKLIFRAHQETEISLDKVAGSLVTTIGESIEDLSKVHDTLGIFI